jgi:hypothetical protein
LKLYLSLEANAPGFSRPAAQNIGPPLQTLWRLAGLLRQSLPTGCSGSDQALSFEVEVEVTLFCTLRSVPGRMSEEPGAQARDLGDGSPLALRHPGITILHGPETLPFLVAHQRSNKGLS